MAVAMNPKKPTPETFPEELRKQFGERADAALQVYPASTNQETLESAAALASDMFISYSTWKWIEVPGQDLGKRIIMFNQGGLTRVHLGPYRSADEARA